MYNLEPQSSSLEMLVNLTIIPLKQIFHLHMLIIMCAQSVCKLTAQDFPFLFLFRFLRDSLHHRYHDDKMINYDTQDGYAVYSVKGPSAHMQMMGMGTAPSSPTPLSDHLFANATTINSRSAAIDGNQRSDAPASDAGDSSSPDKNGSSSSSSTTSATKPNNNFDVEQASSLSLPAMSSMQQQNSNFAKVMLSTSVLSIQEVNFKHAGNYTCAPSNARPVSITVHVLRGKSRTRRQGNSRQRQRR